MCGGEPSRELQSSASVIQRVPLKEPVPSEARQEGSPSPSLFPVPLFLSRKQRSCSEEAAGLTPRPFENGATPAWALRDVRIGGSGSGSPTLKACAGRASKAGTVPARPDGSVLPPPPPPAPAPLQEPRGIFLSVIACPRHAFQPASFIVKLSRHSGGDRNDSWQTSSESSAPRGAASRGEEAWGGPLINSAARPQTPLLPSLHPRFCPSYTQLCPNTAAPVMKQHPEHLPPPNLCRDWRLPLQKELLQRIIAFWNREVSFQR